MTFTITAETRRGQETETSQTATVALHWADEFRHRGATEFKFRDGRRSYLEADMRKLAERERF